MIEISLRVAITDFLVFLFTVRIRVIAAQLEYCSHTFQCDHSRQLQSLSVDLRERYTNCDNY